MNFFLNYVLPNKKLVIDKEKSERLVLDKETINVIEEKSDFPREFPHPISLEDLGKYYSILWKRNLQNLKSDQI